MAAPDRSHLEKRTAVTLFGRAGCPVAADLRVLLDELGIGFEEILLEQDPDPHDACGYVSPSLQINGDRRPTELLVQPGVADVAEALGRHGLRRIKPDGPRRSSAAVV